MNFADITLGNSTQIFDHISENGCGEKALVSIFNFRGNGSVHNCALCRNSNWDLWVDHLPVKGYVHSKISDDYLKNVVIFKHPHIEYAKAFFLKKNQKVIYVNLQSREAKYCNVLSVTDYVYYRGFGVLFYEEGYTKTLYGGGYGTEWVFLELEA